jgi:hypothetical protein
MTPRPVDHDGVAYPSCAALARAFGVTTSAVYNALRRGTMASLGQFAGMTSRERMIALRCRDGRGTLCALTAAERADYDLLVIKGGYDRDAALIAVGRGDLVRP